MNWIDQKNQDGSIYNSLLFGSTGVLCRICKRENSEFAEDWNGCWFTIINVSKDCLTPEVYESKDLDALKLKVEEHIKKYNV